MSRRSDARDADFTAFMTQAGPALLRTAWLLTGDHDRAQELTQASLVKTYVAWPRVREGEALAYARRILVNHRTDVWRATRRELVRIPRPRGPARGAGHSRRVRRSRHHPGRARRRRPNHSREERPMSTTPAADVRAALEQATDVTGLTFDPDAVLTRGRRVVRRRRLVTAGAAAAATAVVAVVAVQLGTGQRRALPALPPAVSTTTTPSGPLSGTTASDGFRQGTSVDVSAVPAGEGTVRETWTMYDGATRLGTVTRTVPALRAGQASFLMPAQSKQKGMVYGYLLTGPQGPDKGYVMTQPVMAPDGLLGNGTGSGGSLLSTSTRSPVGSIFCFGLKRPEELVGVSWNRTKPTTTSVVVLGDGAALRTDRRGGVDATVVTVSSRTSVLLWRDGDRFSFGQHAPAFSDAGALQVGVDPHSAAVAGTENDMAVGWVAGGSVQLTSSDPQDSFTLSYGDPVGGRTPFVARSGRPEVKGTVTVSGGGETQTLAAWDPQP
ncbi:sigma factor [Terrabacter sp. BE26]|uniref:sigma factor n=1 Tax=Terrabacter sp. BE26 TaxID=2898152 RepID=UPI0035BE8E4D